MVVGIWYDINQVGDYLPPTFCEQGHITVLLTGDADVTNIVRVFQNCDMQYLTSLKSPPVCNGNVPTDINLGWSRINETNILSSGCGNYRFFLEGNCYVMVVCISYHGQFKVSLIQNRATKAYRI